MSFEGKVILITGANSGIGKAAAEFFAKEGALLALVGRRAEKFESVVTNIKDFGVELEPLVIVADVSTDAERIIVETVERYERIDILINNAGFSVYGTLEDMRIEDYDAMMATNVRGPVMLTKLAIPYLIETKGNVVNVSSIGGIIPVEVAFAYSMSKAMLDHFTRCAAMELAGRGVRVNSVNPGVIDTEFHAVTGVSEDQEADFYEVQRVKHPLQRIGHAEDVVNAIAFLASDKASFITCEIMKVDGGLSSKGAF